MSLEISAAIQAKRLQMGLSVRELAKRAETSPATISRCENGKRQTKLEVLQRIFKVLELPAYVLTGYEGGNLTTQPVYIREEEALEHSIAAVEPELELLGVVIYKDKGQYFVQNDIARSYIDEAQLRSFIRDGLELIKYRLDRHIYGNIPRKAKKNGERNNKRPTAVVTPGLFEQKA